MPTQTEEQRQRAFQDAGLNATQIANVQKGVPTINSSVLAPTPTIQLPPKPQDTNNYKGIIDSGNAILESLNKLQSERAVQQTPPQQQDNQLESLFQKYLPNLAPPPSATQTYNDLYGTSGIDTLTGAYNEKASAVKAAQSKLAGINAQLAGINAEAQAIPIQQEQQAEGRGITAGGLAPLTAAELRKNALRAIPLQAQAIAAQAEVASAQGDEQLASSLLTQAKDRLDRQFQLHMQDANAQYAYQKDLRDKVYDFATEAEKRRLDALQKADDRKYQEQRDTVQFAQSLAKTAIENGQADVAARISALNPSSPTYRQDVAALEKQITVQKKLDTSVVEVGGRKLLVNNQTGETVKDLGAAGGRRGSGSEVGSTAGERKQQSEEEAAINIYGSIVEDAMKQGANPTEAVAAAAAVAKASGVTLNLQTQNKLLEFANRPKPINFNQIQMVDSLMGTLFKK